MKLKHAKGIHDFNRALAINPTLFQVSVWYEYEFLMSALGLVRWGKQSNKGTDPRSNSRVLILNNAECCGTSYLSSERK